MRSPRYLLASIIAPVLSALATTAGAEPSIDCGHIRLVSAHGVIADEHKYTFTAQCRRHLTKTETKTLPINASTTTNIEHLDFDVIGRGPVGP